MEWHTEIENRIIKVVSSENVLICESDITTNPMHGQHYNPTGEGAVKNAKLISATPDLLESLIDIVIFLEVQKNIYSENRTAKLAFEIKIKEAKNAISKAGF